MEIIKGFEYVNFNGLDVALTIGKFDGLHIGHQTVINELVKISKIKSYKSVLLTFKPHPTKVLGNSQNIDIISDEKKKSNIKRTRG